MNAIRAIEACYEHVVNESRAVDAQTDMQVKQSDKTVEETIEELDETEEMFIETSVNEETAAVATACDDLDIDHLKVETTEVVDKGNNKVVDHATRVTTWVIINDPGSL